MNKKILKLSAICSAAFLLLTGCGKDTDSEASSSSAATPAVPSEPISGDIGKNAFIITLYPEYAPITCENFEKLVTEGFYDGLTFHRIVDGFMAQGGDPAGTGAGGTNHDAAPIKGEFSSNGVDNRLSHQKGVISMARTNDPDSASSQFFICYGDESFLDGNYAAFGEVTEGFEVVESFQTVERKMNAMGEAAVPLTPVVIEKAGMIEDDSKGHPRVMMVMKDFPLATAAEPEETTTAPEETTTEDSGTAVTVTGDLGQNAFIITLYPEYAPITCENFEKLVTEGFYDGLTFHRIVDGFMAQGGDPAGTGAGGTNHDAAPIKGEFSSNGVDNRLSHQKGVISMARTNDPDSASSQFFICYGDESFLDGEYAAFGEVTEGFEVIESFQTVERKMNSLGEAAVPLKPVVIEKAVMLEDDSKGHPRVMMIMKDFPLSK